MPLRNPFSSRRPGLSNGVEPAADENHKPPAFEKVDTIGSKASSALSIGSTKCQEPPEYKLSVVNDSGVYLPPSPPERKAIWGRRSNNSSYSAHTPSSIGEIEPFSISRESFDSYRRSFDISARSPISPSESYGRQSLDSSARLPRVPRASVLGERSFERQPPTAEEGFEDVGLNDEQPKPKKKGFFSRSEEQPEGNAASPSLASRLHLTGRKRGASGQGAELGPVPRPSTASSKEVPEVSA